VRVCLCVHAQRVHVRAHGGQRYEYRNNPRFGDITDFAPSVSSRVNQSKHTLEFVGLPWGRPCMHTKRTHANVAASRCASRRQERVAQGSQSMPPAGRVLSRGELLPGAHAESNVPCVTEYPSSDADGTCTTVDDGRQFNTDIRFSTTCCIAAHPPSSFPRIRPHVGAHAPWVVGAQR
jgi:hypothetical protein